MSLLGHPVQVAAHGERLQGRLAHEQGAEVVTARVCRTVLGHDAAQRDPGVAGEQPVHRIGHRSAGVVKVDVDAVRAFSGERRIELWIAVAHASVEMKVVDDVSASSGRRQCRRSALP